MVITTSRADFFFCGMQVNRDAAPVVGDGHTAVRVDDDVDAVAGAGQRLVDGVVHHLIHQVVERLDVGAAHVHARAAAHGLQAFQDLDIFCAVRSSITDSHE